MLVSSRHALAGASALVVALSLVVAPAEAAPSRSEATTTTCPTSVEPPTVVGDRVAGATLTASVPSAPTDTVGWEWRRDGFVRGTSHQQVLLRTDAGATFEVTTTLTAPDCEPVRSTTDVAVPKEISVLATPAAIAGRPAVGSRLTAKGDTYAPSPYAYTRVVRWFRGNQLLGTSPSYVVRPDDIAGEVRAEVRMTSRYAEDVVSSTAPVEIAAGPLTGTGPSISQAAVGATPVVDPGTVTPHPDDLVTTYRWFRDGVEVAQSRSLPPLGPQDHRAELVVETTATTSGYGTLVQRSEPVAVLGAEATLAVSSNPRAVQVGSTSVVTVRGLGPREPFSVLLSGAVLARGTASPSGTGTATIRVPADATTASARLLRAVGDWPGRTGVTTVATGRAARLGIKLGSTAPTRRAKNIIWVSRLLPHENVTVRIGGKVVLRSKASSTGSFRWTFGVGSSLGRRTLTVTGAGASRTGATSFVVRR